MFACAKEGGETDVATAKEFVEFWLVNSVHADEQYGIRQGRVEVQKLAEHLVAAAEAQGFTKQQVEAEPGDIGQYIRASIDSKQHCRTPASDWVIFSPWNLVRWSILTTTHHF
jgi:hypothetical protein